MLLICQLIYIAYGIIWLNNKSYIFNLLNTDVCKNTVPRKSIWYILYLIVSFIKFESLNSHVKFFLAHLHWDSFTTMYRDTCQSLVFFKWLATVRVSVIILLCWLYSSFLVSFQLYFFQNLFKKHLENTVRYVFQFL